LVHVVYVLAQVQQALQQVAGAFYDTVLAGTLYTLPTGQASLNGIVLFDTLILVPYVLRNRFYFVLL